MAFGIGGSSPVTPNSGSIYSTSVVNTTGQAQSCDHQCTVITLSDTIPLLSLLIIGLVAFGLLQWRREIREKKVKDQETEIAMRKLAPESETSSVAEDLGVVHAVTTGEDEGQNDLREPEKAARSWRPKNFALKTTGWWKL